MNQTHDPARSGLFAPAQVTAAAQQTLALAQDEFGAMRGYASLGALRISY